MKIKFISTASVIVTTVDCCIWTDPWLFGKVFNNSWELFPQIPFDDKDYDAITHVWVSHEHPDHFNFPTLKSLPKEFKERVTLLFQQNHSDKMPNAFSLLGFKNIQLIDNRKITSITDQTKIQVVRVGSMDSSLAVMDGDVTLLNVNDCEISESDCQTYVKDLGKIDILLNQFSMAGYNGYHDYRKLGPISAAKIMDNLVWNHKSCNATLTMPFASNINYCCEDNKHVNTFANTPMDVSNRFLNEQLNCLIIYPGEEYDTTQGKWDNTASLAKFQQLYATLEQVEIDPIEKVSLDEIEREFNNFCGNIRDRYPWFVYRKLAAVNIEIPDLNGVLTVSIKDEVFEFHEAHLNTSIDLKINSQPLHFAFKFPFGIQTLGVSGRFLVMNSSSPWKWYRIISSMNNSEVYLSLKYLFSAKTLAFIQQTFRQGIGQFIHQWRVRVTDTSLDN